MIEVLLIELFAHEQSFGTNTNYLASKQSLFTHPISQKWHMTGPNQTTN